MKKKMEKEIYPSIRENMSKWSERKILMFTKYEQFIYNILHESTKWRENYEIIYNEDETGYWVKQLKGVIFDTKEEAELYCFLNYCEDVAKKIY